MAGSGERPSLHCAHSLFPVGLSEGRHGPQQGKVNGIHTMGTTQLGPTSEHFVMV